jgi:glycosyltransferase involved in cell wall biosynthesis
MFVEPMPPPIPAVVLIPDLSHETYPEHFEPDILALRTRDLRPGARRARRVVTLSEFCRAEMLRSFELAPERVVVMPLASGLAPELDAVAVAESGKRLGLTSPYFFYPANDWPNKNHRTPFEALAVLRERGLTPQLVLTGARLRGRELQRQAEAVGVADQVRDLGWVKEQDLRVLYSGATAVLLPTLFEGFCLPAVEAMRCGVPVLANPVAALPEVSGGHALWIDAGDPGAWADALQSLLVDPRRLDAQVEEARRFALRYSWERSAGALHAAFKAAAAGPEQEDL